MPAMLGCNTKCPNCEHQFACCPPRSQCICQRRSVHGLSGGGIVTALVPPPSPCPSPQVSPSVPLSFVLPPFAAPGPLQLFPYLEHNEEAELQRLTSTVRALRQSGWYYEGLTFQQSHDLLNETKIGTFLVRNSADPNFLYSLSVQTERGPTSVRLHYINGYFRLDAQPHLQPMMPLFPSVIDLVQHYVQQCKIMKNNPQVWVDGHGKWYSSIWLEYPLKKKQEPVSLKHISRLAIHKALQSSDRPKLAMLPPPHTELELPKSLVNYLSEYPHSI